MWLFIGFLLVNLSCFSSASRNDQPIIGILTQDIRNNPNQSYIAASYVKFLESAGARVIPVIINQTEREYKTLFNSINGIFFPGGAVSLSLSGYARTAKIFYNLAIEANQKGDYFPVWGTCLGFQQLTYLTTQERLLVNTDTSSVSLPLNFTSEANSSRMFRDIPAVLMEALATEPLTINAHKWSVSMETYNTNEELNKFYKVLSTNTDGKTEFISSMEAYDYPIYGIQWHPEKNTFEWTRPFYDHSPNGIKVAFYIADFFVNEARKNLHSICEDAARKLFIYNHIPVYTGYKSVFEQKYYFEFIS